MDTDFEDAHLLRVHSLNQYHGESHTLWDLDLEVPAQSCTVLMGRNGVGKTTLLQCVMGLLPVESGDITYSGSPLQSRGVVDRARMGIGYVPQGRQIFPLLTVEENLRIGLPARADGSQEFPAQDELLPKTGRWRAWRQPQCRATSRVVREDFAVGEVSVNAQAEKVVSDTRVVLIVG